MFADQSINTGTQADQVRVDSEKKKKAMKELVTSWQDRLQLTSIIVSSNLTPVGLSSRITVLRDGNSIDHFLRWYGSPAIGLGNA